MSRSNDHIKNTFLSSLLFTFFAVVLIFLNQTDIHAGYLYVLNDDSTGSRIYGFQVDEQTGALTLLSGFPLTAGSGGFNSIVSERMFADTANRRLYIINDTTETISAYSIDILTGALAELPFSPIMLGPGTWNTIAVHPSGSPLVVGNGSSTTGGGGVRSFTITATTATPAAGNPFPTTGTTAFTSEFSQDGQYYYVGGNTGTGISGFEVSTSTGVLTPLPGSPFSTGASNPLAYAIDSSGRLFTMNSNDDIRAFTSSNGVLSPVTGNPFPPSGMTQRRFGIVHPNQNFYMIAGNSGNNVGVFQISGSGADTTLTPAPGSPYPTGGTTANNLAINLDGTFLYVGNRISRNITTFSVNTSTGQLTSLGVQPSNTLGNIGAINGIAYVPDIPVLVTENPRADFDGDGRTDLSVFRPSEGNWYLQRSTDGFAAINWGIASDALVPGDYDGDGKTDAAIFRASDTAGVADFYILNSSSFTFSGYEWGSTGDIPVVGDYDGDSKTDVAVYRPADGNWYIVESSGGVTVFNWGGQAGDVPLVGDFDGDNESDYTVRRGTNWLTSFSAGGSQTADFGMISDQPVQADYDGDNKDDIAVFRPGTGAWTYIASNGGAIVTVLFGTGGDIPVPGDYDGDGRYDQAVYRGGTWYLNQSTNGFFAAPFGLAADSPVPRQYLP